MNTDGSAEKVKCVLIFDFDLFSLYVFNHTYIKNRCGATVLGNKKHFKLNNCGSDPKCFSDGSPYWT